MELKEGMYVRYKTLSNQIKIAKIIEIDNKKILGLDNKDYTAEKYIIGEPSYNIIDLIEEGDYVNGFKVDNIGHNYLIFYDSDGDIEIFNEDIKSIVTKEQFESMKYEISNE